MDSPEAITPAQQVEKIREILVGRDMELVNGRIRQLESRIERLSNDITRELTGQAGKADRQYKASQVNIRSLTSQIHQQLRQETTTRDQQINSLAKKIDDAATRIDRTTQQLIDADTERNNAISKKMENLISEMTSRIDSHSRQIMEHVHREIQQWKTRTDGQISLLTENKVDRQEMASRLARIASATMEDTAMAATTPLAVPRNGHTTPDKSPTGEFACPGTRQ